ncbi:MAG: hypothetical protein K0B85_08500, partial [Coriobacteriia bacterium]|nr:hypothetical protein [Coriobacteriia bacterium]
MLIPRTPQNLTSGLRLGSRTSREIKKGIHLLLILVLVAAASPWVAPPETVAASDEGGWFPPVVPNPTEAFQALSRYPDALGFHRGNSGALPETDTHYQGMARYEVNGVPWFAVTQNGNGRDWKGYLDLRSEWEPGYVYGVCMASKSSDFDADRRGERLGSNRLAPGGAQTKDTEPLSSDQITWTRNLDPYSHPDGVQVVDGYLIVGMDSPRVTGYSYGRIQAYELDQGGYPMNPVFRKEFDHGVDTFAITKWAGKYLLLVQGDGGHTNK